MRLLSPYNLTLIASCLLIAQVATDQAVFTSPQQAPQHDLRPPDASSFNLIDLLSQSSQHTILLRLLQRVRLLPTINRLQEFDDGSGLTILAPTDQAFLNKRDAQRNARIASTITQPQAKGIWEWVLDDIGSLSAQDTTVPIWVSDGFFILDNVNAVARQHLLYHFLNYTLPYNLTSDTGSHSPDAPLPQVGKPIVHETMHFPSRRLLREPTRPGHIPRPDEEDHGGLLGIEGQKIRIATIEQQAPDAALSSYGLRFAISKNKTVTYLTFGSDVRGQGGARSVYEDWSSIKGVIHSIDNVLDLPPSLETVLQSHSSLERLRSLLSPDLVKSLSTTAHLSLFLPTSDAFASLSDLEWKFLSGKWQKSFQDRLKVMGWHTTGVGMGAGRPSYAHRLRKQGETRLTTVLGGEVTVKVDDANVISVNDARVVEEDIFTENGVVHLIDHLILPFGDLDMTVEKHLLALNASKFVDLVYDAGLEDYIDRPPRNDTEEAFTFLAPRDDVIDNWLDQHRKQALARPLENALIREGDDSSPSLEEVIKYHILPGKFRPKDLVDGMLLGTELRDWKLREGRQRIPVEVDDGNTASERQGNGDVGFGDANVLREPVQVKDGSIIYVISQLLEPPSNPIQTAVSHLSLSTFVATVFSAELKKAVQRAPGVTYMIPTNDALSGLGLAMSYLLLPESQSQLQALIEYHAIDKVVYMEDFTDEITQYPTLLPDKSTDLSARKLENGTVQVGRTGDDFAPAAKVIKGDILTNTGVIHEIDRVQVPFELSIKNLMRGAKADTMEDLINQAGYGYILNGTDPQSKEDNNGTAYVVLVPTDNAFTRVNLSQILEDPDSLVRLVQQHIIPIGKGMSIDDILPDGRRNRLQLEDATSYATLLDKSAGGSSAYGKISFRRLPRSKDGEESDRSVGHPHVPPSQPRIDTLGWMVGIKDTRGASGAGHAADILAFGRESKQIDSSKGEPTRRTRVGGIIQIDAVLKPYEPGWFYRWGWVVLASAIVALLLSVATLAAYRWWTKDGRIRLPEALEGEEE